MPDQSIAQRGMRAVQTILRVDMEAYFDAVQNIYHPTDNPDGAFPLNVAENKLAWHILRDKIQSISSQKQIPAWVAGYTSGKGAPSFRVVLADFISQFIGDCPIDPERLLLSAGATSTVEVSSLVLGDAGDVAAFPAPCYPVYKQDIGNVAALERYDIITHHHLDEIQDEPALSIADLERTQKDIEGQGKRFRMLVLTQPNNPTGSIYRLDQLTAIADWCISNKVHLVVNEIYGLSMLHISHPDISEDYHAPTQFHSFLGIMHQKRSDYMHWWYAFSKDFGISGFRMGVAYSYNDLFVQAYENLNYSNLVSNYAQWIMEEVLSDHDFVRHYIQENQQLLTDAYAVIIKTLKQLNIPYVPARGSLFVWLDFSEFLVAQTLEAENTFWEQFYRATNILLTPGQGFGHSKRGLFRVVYPFFEPKDLKVAMQRLEAFVLQQRG